jgi:hypothetical protein
MDVSIVTVMSGRGMHHRGSATRRVRYVTLHTGLTSLVAKAPRTSRSLAPWVFGAAFAVILLSRNPGVILHAELWGEDGWFWYPDAYNAGWHSLLWPHTGYLQTISRLVALAVQPGPLTWAPTLFAGAALVMQALPAAFLLSERMDTAWPSILARLLFGFIYVALPNSFEVYANLTNAQWHLAVLAFLILVSQPARSRSGIVFDSTVLMLSGLSGPFCLFLMPIAGWQWLAERAPQSLWRLSIVALTCAVQAACLLATMAAMRSSAPLGADPVTLTRIVGLQILLGPLLGSHVTSRLSVSQPWQFDVVPILLALAGLVLSAVAIARGSPLLRKAVLFGGLVFVATLWHPQTSLIEPQWLVLTRPGASQRYYLLPMLAWIAVLLSLANDTNRSLRPIGLMLVVLLFVGITGDWRYPRLAPTGFAEKARTFASAPPGTRMEFGIHPPGGTPMVLVKHER